jgi:hypothetical protein
MRQRGEVGGRERRRGRGGGEPTRRGKHEKAVAQEGSRGELCGDGGMVWRAKAPCPPEGFRVSGF